MMTPASYTRGLDGGWGSENSPFIDGVDATINDDDAFVLCDDLTLLSGEEV